MPASPPLLPVLALLLGALSLFGTAPAEAQQTRTYALTASVTAAEGGNAELTVTLGEAAPPGGLAFDVSYDYSVSGATATDTGTTPTTVTVLQGRTTATISVPLIADRDWDNGETFTVTITPASGVTGWSVASGGTATSTVTITDGAASVTFNEAAYSFSENAGSPPVSYHAQALSYVGYSIGRLTSADGTASGGGVDYSFVERNFGFNPFVSVCQPRSLCGPEIEPLNYRSTDRTLSVDVTNDDLVEDDETFTITLVPPAGWSAKPHATTTVTITDNDRAGAKIAFGSAAAGKSKYTASVDEDVTGGTLDVPVTVSHLPGSSTTFDIEVLATGTATDGADYRIDTKSVTFGPTDNSKTKNLSIAIVDDSDSEFDETVELRIAAADETVDDLGDYYARDANGSLATLTITNDDDVPAAPTDLTFTPGAAKLGLAWMAPGGPLTGYDVHYTSAASGTVADGATVQAGSDDTAGWVDAGHTGTAAEHEITGLDNGTAYRVRVRAKNGNGDGAWLIGTGTPEPQPPSALTLTTSAANDTVAEDAGTVTVTATLNRPVIEDEVTVTLSAASGTTATATDDYVLPGAFRIAKGETSATADVTIVDDDLDEDDKSLVLTATAGTLSVAGVTLTIADDDTAGVTVSTRTLSVTAGGTAGYTVVLDSKPTANVTVTPTSSAGATVSAALTFTPSNWSTAQPVTVTGVAAGTATVTHTADSTDADYTSSLAIDSVSATVSSSRAFWISPEVTGAEGGNAELTVTLGGAAPSGGLAFDVSYDYSTGGATAADTGTTPSTVTVLQGRTTATISVPLTADRSWDNGESFRLTIASATGVTGWSVASGGTATATVTITDDAASVTFREAAYTFSENAGSPDVSYQWRAQTYVGESLGSITSADGTATGGGVDYDFAGGGIGYQRSGAVGCDGGLCYTPYRTRTVTLTNDDLVEEDETFTVTLVPPPGWSAKPHGTATVTIADDDRAVARIAFGSRAGARTKYAASVDEDVTGGTLEVPVTVNRLPGSPTTFDIEVLATGTAAAYVDYRIDTQSVTFGPTDTGRTKNLSIAITNDTALEPDETIELRIAAADETVDDLGDHYARDANGSLATLTIANDDVPLPTFEPDGSAVVTNADTDITLTFAAAVKKDASASDFAATDLQGVLTLRTTDAGGTNIPYTASINPAGTVITINPNAALPDGVVHVAISNGYFDATGNRGSAASGSFTVDTTGPVPDFSPANGATVADPATNITLTFDEPVKKNAGGGDFTNSDLSRILTLKKTDSGGADIAYAASIDTAKKVITIDPAANLEGGAVYVGISNAFYDAAGNRGQAASATYSVRSTVPTRLQVTAGNAKLALEWIAPTGTLTGYDVHYTSAPKSGTGVVADSAAVQSGGSPSDADGWVDAEHTGTGASQAITGLTNGAEYRVRVRARNGNSAGEWVFGAATPKSDDATLSALAATGSGSVDGAFTALTLTPDFAAGTTAYAATVAGAVTHVKLTPTVTDSDASVTVAGNAVASGSSSDAIALALGANEIAVVVTAEDGTTKTYTVTVTRQSGDATLNALAVAGGESADGTFTALTLTPAFAAATTAYAATVASTVTHAKLTPTVTDSNAGVTVAGSAVTSGSSSDAIALTLGANEIAVAVTAEDGSTQTYTVTVTRQSGDATLSGLSATSSGSADGTFTSLTLTPAFAAGTTAYTAATVTSAVTHAKLTPTVTDSNASVTVAGNAVTSGSSSAAIALDVGANEIAVVVTAEDGSTQTYTVTVTRQSGDATLSALAATSSGSADGTFTALTLTPEFSASTTAYAATVAGAVTHVKLTPTTTDTNAGVTVAGNAVTSGSSSDAIALSLGANEIAVAVTAEDGSTQTYTVTVTRQSGDATLSDLSGSTSTDGSDFSGALTLTPDFAAGTTAYAATVADDISHAKLTPTVTDSDAGVTVAGNAVTSGSSSAAVALNVGANEIAVVVTAEDGTTRTYTVTVTRQSGDATLSALTASAGTSADGTFTALALTPDFAAGTTAYAATVASAFTHVKLTPTTNDANAEVTVGGATVASGSASDAVAVAAGANEIAVVVTADNGTTQTYTVTVTRQSSAATSLALTTSAANDTVAEDVGAVLLTATLDRLAPPGGVQVRISTGTGTDATQADYSVSFPHITIPENRDSALTDVKIFNDAVEEADESVVFTATAGSLAVTGVTLTITDDDTAGVTVSVEELSVGVGADATGTYAIKLDSQPAGNVTVTPASADTTKATVSSALEFTPDNWLIEQEVTVTGVAAGEVSVTHSITASADARYPTSLSIDSVAVEVTAGVCGRTQAVIDALQNATGIFDCKLIAGVHLAKVTDLSVFDAELTALAAGDLDGLPGLKNLAINAQLASLPDLSALALLETLDVYGNQLTSLPDLSSNTKLTRITATQNRLASLPDLSALVLLDTLQVSDNLLTSLPDLSKNIKLEFLDLYNNPLANLDSLSLTGSDGNPVSLNVAFDADTLEYTADAGLGVTSVTVTATVVDTGVLAALASSQNPAPTIFVNSPDGRQPVASGAPSPAIKLNAAQTSFSVDVEGRGSSYKSYTVTVNASTKTYALTSSATAGEGDNAHLTVTLGEAAPTGGLALSVAYDYSGGTASAEDTGATPSSITVDEGAFTATLTIPIASDDLVEGDETFTVTISTSESDWAAGADGASATVTIEDDDDDFATVAFGPDAAGFTKHAVPVAENVSDGTVNVPVTVSHLPGASTTFAIEVLSTGTATEYASAQAPGDFRIETKSVTFGPTDTDRTKNVAVTITNDSDLEPDETIELGIAAADDPVDDLGDHYLRDGNGSLATVTVENDELPPAPTSLDVTAGDAKLDLAWTAPTLPSGVTPAGYDVHYTSALVGTVADGADLQAGNAPSAADGWVDAGHSGTAASHTISGLDNGTAYRLRVRARVAAGGGAWLNGSGTPVSSTTTPPEFSPANGATETDASTDITLTFAEAVKKSDGSDFSGHAELSAILMLKAGGSGGTAIPYAASIDADKKVITLDPSNDLADGDVYVAVSDAWWNAGGNRGKAASATFTVDSTGPAAPDFSPADGARVKDVSTNITLTFAEALRKDATGTALTTTPTSPPS